ncbi:YxlC family protein [Sutcliffiella sp. NPDC057660]|uniref:YxlC family protein n=1 Tax=Sutcliffiella sp. NPDC057660 TaxID=3346199 RepID=UPI0036AEA902
MSRQDNEKDNTISKLQKDWKQLDELGTPPIPTLETLNEQLYAAKVERKRAFHKELSIFIITALVILTALTAAVLQAPTIFIVTQVSALIVAPIIFYVLTKRNQEGRILS